MRHAEFADRPILSLSSDSYLAPLFQRRRVFERCLKAPQVIAAVAALGDQGRRFSATCPVCGYPTLHTRGNFNICSLCNWEDDGQDDAEFAPHETRRSPDDVGGPNYSYSLSEARFNFAQHLQMYRPFDIRRFGEMAEGIELRRALVAAYESMLPDVSSDMFIAALPRLVSRFSDISEALARQRTERRLAGQPSNKNPQTEEPSFTLSGRRPNSSLRFDSFRYQGQFNQDSVEHFGSDWLRCRAILTTKNVNYSLPTSFMINELTDLSEMLERGASAGPDTELSFDSREGDLWIRVTGQRRSLTLPPE